MPRLPPLPTSFGGFGCSCKLSTQSAPLSVDYSRGGGVVNPTSGKYPEKTRQGRRTATPSGAAFGSPVGPHRPGGLPGGLPPSRRGALGGWWGGRTPALWITSAREPDGKPFGFTTGSRLCSRPISPLALRAEAHGLNQLRLRLRICAKGKVILLGEAGGKPGPRHNGRGAARARGRGPGHGGATDPSNGPATDHPPTAGSPVYGTMSAITGNGLETEAQGGPCSGSPLWHSVWFPVLLGCSPLRPARPGISGGNVGRPLGPCFRSNMFYKAVSFPACRGPWRASAPSLCVGRALPWLFLPPLPCATAGFCELWGHLNKEKPPDAGTSGGQALWALITAPGTTPGRE